MSTNSGKYVVISASRMTDMPAWYPDIIITETEKRKQRGLFIHTLVLWTKHPASVISAPLKEYLRDQMDQGTQLYIHLTITGMGGLMTGKKKGGAELFIEPGTPPYLDSLKLLPQLIGFAGKPERVRVRIDPLVRIRDGDGKVFSNDVFLPVITREAASHGVRDFSFSFLEKGMHAKVDRRFSSLGCEILSPDEMERRSIFKWIQETGKRYHVNFHACCIPGLAGSSCIDGQLLTALHDQKLPADTRLPVKLSRPLCGCTRSVDIGGWPPRSCRTGCDYCYARPVYR